MPRINVLEKLHLGEPRSEVAVNVLDDDLFGRIAQTSVGGATPGGAAGAPSTTGLPAHNVVGTTAENFQPEGVFAQYTTTTANGALGGWVVSTTLASFRFDNLARFRFIMRTGGTLTDLVYWVGFIPEGGGGTRAATPNNFVVFRWNPSPSAGVGDTTNWSAVTVNNAGTSTVTDTGVAVVADTIYEFHILVVSTTQVEFYINKVLVATHTNSASLPADDEGLGPTLHVVNGTSGAARVIRAGLIRGRYESSHAL